MPEGRAGGGKGGYGGWGWGGRGSGLRLRVRPVRRALFEIPRAFMDVLSWPSLLVVYCNGMHTQILAHASLPLSPPGAGGGGQGRGGAREQPPRDGRHVSDRTHLADT